MQRVHEDVEELVADRSGFRAFQLNNALFEGNVERALIELERVLSAGEAEERVVAQVGREVIALMTVQRSAGLPTDAVATASGLNASRVAGLQTKAAGISEPAMTAISESVRRADASVKTGLQTDTSATIVPLVAEVAEVVRRGGVGRRR